MVPKMSAFLMTLIAVALAYPTSLRGPQHQPEPSNPFSFEYSVHDDYSGQHFKRKEFSDGKPVQGSYTVDLPNGSKQTVNFQADPFHGFVADVQHSPQPYGKVDWSSSH